MPQPKRATCRPVFYAGRQAFSALLKMSRISERSLESKSGVLIAAFKVHFLKILT